VDAPAPGWVAWESTHFLIMADLRLPPGVARDLAAVFEATHAALLAVPLSLELPKPGPMLPVRLLSTTEGYLAAGGFTASGGHFNGREMLILLPNLGIEASARGLTANHQRNLFVLKHEVTHQLLARDAAAWPMWLREGFAECVASWPYAQGRYSFEALDSAMRTYLLKWERPNVRRPLPILPPARLMGLSENAWSASVKAQAAYTHYNSAALLTHYFLRHDRAPAGAGLTAYLTALRAGTSEGVAEGKYLLRGRTPERLAEEIKALARRLGVEIVFSK